MKKFKGRKKSNNLIIYIGLFFMSIAFSINYLYRENMINEDTIVEILVNDNLGNYKKDFKNIDFLFKYALNTDLIKSEKVATIETEEEKLEIDTDKIISAKNSEPLVYIYNTHQEEKYESSYVGEYNISATVKIASKVLKEYLENLGIGVIVEEDSVTDKLHSLNWKYGYSYKVSRMFLENAYKEHSSLRYFIDIHRDSSVYDRTTTIIDGEKYARGLFVVGLDHDNYEPNLALAEKLRSKIDQYNSTLCRGIMKKSGKGVNGIYNQDFNPNVMLIEVGGQYNNISEVNNTLKVLANILVEYIKEDGYE